MLRNLVETALFYRDGPKTFFDLKDFPWVTTIEANRKLIRRELDEVMVRREEIPNFQDVSKNQSPIAQADDWKTFMFYTFGFGNKNKENCKRCPETTRLLHLIPGMTMAFFSILAPGKHIPAHRGPYKGVLRYHVGLKIPGPEGSCRIRVGNDIGYWHEGQSMIFDDSNEHEVWNDSDSDRVVLFVDFVRPTAFPLSLVNRSIIWARGCFPF